MSAGLRQPKSAFCDCCSAAAAAGAGHYAAGGPSDGGLNTAGTNSMVYSATSQGRRAHQPSQDSPFAWDIVKAASVKSGICETEELMIRNYFWSYMSAWSAVLLELDILIYCCMPLQASVWESENIDFDPRKYLNLRRPQHYPIFQIVLVTRKWLLMCILW